MTEQITAKDSPADQPVGAKEAERNGRYALQDGFKVAISFLYMWWWSVRARIRSVLEENARTILAVSLFMLIVEILLEFFAVRVAHEASAALRGFLATVFLVVLYSKFREFRDREREFTFTEVCRAVVEAVGPSSGGGREFKEQVRRILSPSAAIFKDTVVFLWTPDGAGVLAISQAEPKDSAHDAELKLNLGQGGAGLCCKTSEVVYFPRVGVRHAVTQDIENSARFSIIPDLYVRSDVENYVSVLCVPVLSYGDCYGVLSFCSTKANQFGRLDFSRAAFFGFALAETFRYHKRSGHRGA